MIKYITYISIGLCLLLASCSGISKKEYVDWAGKTGNHFYTEYQDALGTRNSIQYKTSTYCTLQEYFQEIYSQSDLEKYRTEFDSTMVFEFRMYTHILDSLPEDLAYELKYGMADMFQLELDDQFYKPQGYFFEKYDAAKPYTSFNIIFDAMRKADHKKVAFRIKENAYGIQPHAMMLTQQDLNNEPHLKF